MVYSDQGHADSGARNGFPSFFFTFAYKAVYLIRKSGVDNVWIILWIMCGYSNVRAEGYMSETKAATLPPHVRNEGAYVQLGKCSPMCLVGVQS